MTRELLHSEQGPPPDEPHGRADLHIHTLASDGVCGVDEVLDWVVEHTQLDVIAIADHERVDAAHAARAMARARGLPIEVVIGEEVTTRGGHLLALFIEEAVPPLRSLRESIGIVHEQGGLAIPAHPLFPYPLCAQAPVLRGLLQSADPRVRLDAIEAFNPTTFGRPVHRRVVAFAAEHGLPVVGNSDAHDTASIGAGWTTFPGHTAEDVRAAILEGRTGWHGSFHQTVSQLPVFGRQLRKYGRDARAELAGRVRRDGTGRDRGYPGGNRRPPVLDADAIETGRAGRRAMKIGLVTPYVYPLPGGVNDHVGHLYESLRARGHDVRILSASHGLQRRSEGDVIRIGKGFSVPANGSMGTLTISPRYRSQIRGVLAEERFDLLHFHEPFVPFLSLVTLRESRSVNVATFHAYAGYAPGYQIGGRMLGPVAASRLHGRIAVSAAARHFADRYLPGDYKVIPNGVDLPRFSQAVPLARWQDGRPNILFVGRLEPRKGLLHLLKAFRMVRKAGSDCRLLVVGSGPLEREARRYVMTRRLQGVEFLGRVSDQEKVQLFKTADVYVSPATGRESFGIVLLEAMAAGTAIICSDIHGYKGVVRRDVEALLVPPGDHRALAEALLRLVADPALRARLETSGLARAEEFGWDRVAARVEAYYGFVIRRLAAQEALPPHFGAPVPPDERRPGSRA